MRSTSPPMLWVYATHDGTEHKCSVVMRDGEGLDDAMGRGCRYILDTIEGVSYLTDVRTETMDVYEYDRPDPLMGGQISGGTLKIDKGGRP